MSRCVFLIFAANLCTTRANPFPVEQGSISLFDPDPETQPGFMTDSPFDESLLGVIDFPPQAEDQGDSSNVFGLPSNSMADNPSEELLTSGNLDDSASAFDGSSCGIRSSSGTLLTDPELALDLFEYGIVDARGFFDDVDQLQNEVIDPPDGGLCAAPDLLNSQKRRGRPPGPGVKRPQREIGQEIDEKNNIHYPVKNFGKCPVLQPEYTEALCCTGRQYGIYVLKCAPGMTSAASLPSSCHPKPSRSLSPEADQCIALVSFFCGHETNQYCCQTYNSYVSYPANSQSHVFDFRG